MLWFIAWASSGSFSRWHILVKKFKQVKCKSFLLIEKRKWHAKKTCSYSIKVSSMETRSSVCWVSSLADDSRRRLGSSVSRVSTTATDLSVITTCNKHQRPVFSESFLHSDLSFFGICLYLLHTIFCKNSDLTSLNWIRRYEHYDFLHCFKQLLTKTWCYEFLTITQLFLNIVLCRAEYVLSHVFVEWINVSWVLKKKIIIKRQKECRKPNKCILNESKWNISWCIQRK